MWIESVCFEYCFIRDFSAPLPGRETTSSITYDQREETPHTPAPRLSTDAL